MGSCATASLNQHLDTKRSGPEEETIMAEAGQLQARPQARVGADRRALDSSREAAGSRTRSHVCSRAHGTRGKGGPNSVSITCPLRLRNTANKATTKPFFLCPSFVIHTRFTTRSQRHRSTFKSCNGPQHSWRSTLVTLQHFISNSSEPARTN